MGTGGAGPADDFTGAFSAHAAACAEGATSVEPGRGGHRCPGSIPNRYGRHGFRRLASADPAGAGSFFVRPVDGRFGTNLQTTVRAYQQEHKLQVNGSVDDATWKARSMKARS
ncbi:MAG TPA: peptidoglycan-binding domain-containing protein [Verrucomicrobiae bacterium]|nr:peptidoglycan-binding domain-containing protein [Verrucomicrobiae bacterium]